MKKMMRCWAVFIVFLLTVTPSTGFAQTRQAGNTSFSVQEVKLGNIFVGTQEAQFKVVTSYSQVAWYVDDFWGNQVTQGQNNVHNGNLMLNIPMKKKGYFTLHISAIQHGQTVKSLKIPFAFLSKFDTSTIHNSQFGVNTHFGQGESLAYMPLIAEAGIKNIRDELYWNNIERKKGVFTFPAQYNDYMNQVKQNRLNPLIIADYGNPLYDGGKAPTSQTGLHAFGAYAQHLLQHYPQIHAIEVWNEFNGSFNGASGKVSDYFHLLKSTYQAVKAEHPNVTVLGSVYQIPMGWLKQLFQLGGLKYMDALAIHPYKWPKPPEGFAQQIQKAETLIKQYNNGKPKPIWVTENGWTTQTGLRGVSESTQAQYLVRSSVLCLAGGAQKVFWYDFMNNGVNPGNQEFNFGIIRNKKDPKGAYTPKPAYVSYAVLTRELTGAKFVRSENLLAKGIRSDLFRKGSTETQVLWSTHGSQNVTVKANGPLTLTDMMGNQKTLKPYHGEVFLTLSGDPIYLTGHLTKGSRLNIGRGQRRRGGINKNSDSVDIIPDSKISIDVPSTMTPGDKYLPITLNVNNSASHYPTDVVFSVGGQSYRVKAKGGQNIKRKVDIPTPNIRIGGDMLFTDIRIHGHQVGELRSDIKLTKKVISLHSVVPEIQSVNPEQETLQVNVRNNSATQSAVWSSVDWTIRGVQQTRSFHLDIAPNTTKKVLVPVVSTPFYKTEPATVVVHMQNPERQQTWQGPLTFSPVIKKSLGDHWSLSQLRSDPSVDLTKDGKYLSLKPNDPYAGSNDLSGKVWFNWDQNNLYVTAKIKDNKFYEPYSGTSMWQGDSIQFSIAPGLPNSRNESYQYGMALTPKGPQLFAWITPNPIPYGLVTNAKLHITRDEQTGYTTYELALPWSDLKPFSLGPNQPFSLSLMVNDNDGQGEKGVIEWGGGIAGGANPGKFNEAQLMK